MQESFKLKYYLLLQGHIMFIPSLIMQVRSSYTKGIEHEV
jgi:hypothetical protein